jgi:hypothetical protein
LTGATSRLIKRRRRLVLVYHKEMANVRGVVCWKLTCVSNRFFILSHSLSNMPRFLPSHHSLERCSGLWSHVTSPCMAKLQDVGNDHLLSMRGGLIGWHCHSHSHLAAASGATSATRPLFPGCAIVPTGLGGSGGLPCPEPWVSLNCHSTFLEAQGPQPSRHRIISDQITFPTLPWVQSNARKMTCSTWV